MKPIWLLRFSCIIVIIIFVAIYFYRREHFIDGNKVYSEVRPLLSSGQLTYENFKTATGITDNPPVFFGVKKLYDANLLTPQAISGL